MMMECRAKPATRIRIEFPGKDPQILTMNRPYLLIGSNPACDLRIDHDDAKPQHVFLQWVNGQIFCCDLVPRVGNDPRQQIKGRWLDNEPIKIGRYRISIDNHELPIKFDDSPLDRSSHVADEFPQLAFQFVGVEQSENLWTVNRTLTMIGRGSQCKLRLNHTSMPNIQACLLRTRHCCWLVDIEGTGTTGVNGRAISVAPIDIGDILQLGPFQIEVVTTSIANQDLSALGSTKRPDRSKQTSNLERQNQVAVQPSTLTEKKVAEPAQHPKQSTIKESWIDPEIQPELDPEAAKPSLVASKPVEVPEEEQSISELNQNQPISISETLPISEPMPAPTEPLELSIASFIQAHESQLAVLKTQLEQVKLVYDKPRSQAISKRARSMLDESISETLKTHKLMHESLEKLSLQIKR
jgi:hypothetical protein